MSLKKSIGEKPHAILFKFCLVLAVIGGIIWRYDKFVGYSHATQGTVEQFFRLMIGSLIVFVPMLLLYALIYWLMYRFKRPTRPILNFYHLVLLVVFFVIQLFYSSKMLIFDSGSSPLRGSNISYILRISSFAAPALFLYNVVVSLVKPNLEEEEASLE